MDSQFAKLAAGYSHAIGWFSWLEWGFGELQPRYWLVSVAGVLFICLVPDDK